MWVACHSFDYDAPWFEDTTEETFRPWTGALPFDPQLGMAVVASTFTLPDGTVVHGFATPQPMPLADASPDLGLMQPHVFGKGGGSLGFWTGMLLPGPDFKARFYRSLGRPPEAVFPLSFAAASGLTSGLCAGTLPGFCYVPDCKTLTFAR